MKNPLLCLALCIFACTPIHSLAQTWTDVGTPRFTAAEADFESIAIGKNDTPFVAYEDYANGEKATVMKFNGTSWVTVGTPGFSGDVANYTSLVIDSSGTPYVVYEDYADTFKATVMKFNGSSWVTVGRQGFSIGIASYTTMAIGSSDTPYVAFLDQADSGVPKLSVAKYDGTNWVYIGGPRFSPIITYPVSLAVWGNTPYIAYGDTTTGKATVWSWNGSSWVIVGAPGFSAGGVASLAITIAGGMPYVTYSDDANSLKATVMKYNGTAWLTVGTAGFSAAEADNTTIAVDNSGTPYVVYADAATTDDDATVMKYNGTAWVNVGSPGMSGSLAEYNSIAINSTGIPYVFYQGFSGGQKGTVEKFAATTGVANTGYITASLSVFPNPGHGSFTLHITSLQNEPAAITITNILGEKVKQLTAPTNENTEIQLNAAPGVYFITAKTQNETLTEKVVVE